jgi:WD40 repeat protein
VWDVATGKVISRLPRPTELRSARFVLGHGAVLIVGERELELRDASGGKVIGRLPLPTGAREDPLISANGRYLVLDGEDDSGASTLTLWDLNGLKSVGRIVTGERATGLAADPLGRLLAVGDGERFVRVWRARDQSLVAECEHAGAPVAAVFDGNGRWLATQDDTDRLRVWDLDAGCRAVVSRQGNGAWQVAFAADGAGLVVGNLSRGYELVALPGGERIGSAFQPGMTAAGSAPRSQAATPRLLPGAATLVTYDGRKALKLWSLPWRTSDGPAPLEPGAEQLAVSADRSHLALGTLSGDVRIVPLGPASALRLGTDGGPGFIGHVAAITSLAFAADGRLLASGSLDGAVRVWEVAGGAPRGFFAAHGDGAVQALAFLPDGSGLVSASPGSVLVIDTASGAIRARLLIQAARPHLAVAPDGASVLIAGDQDGLTRWDWRGGAATALGSADYRVRLVALSADGQLLATAGADRAVRLWRPQAGSPLRRAFIAPAPVSRLWFDADGRTLAVQAGAWLHTLELDASGLIARRSRPLPDADTLLAPGPGREWLALTAASTLNPGVARFGANGSWAPAPRPGAMPSPDLVRARLRLTVNELGEIRPRD